MCHDDNSRPPASPTRLGGASGKDVVLTSADGTKFLAYIAEPDVPKKQGSQIVIYPDAGGISPFYKELAQRFAEIGIRAITIDYYGHSIPFDQKREGEIDYMSLVPKLTAKDILADLAAAFDYLHSGQHDQEKPTFVVGFCLGGSISLLAGTVQWDRKYNIRGVIPFYASLKREMFGLPGNLLDYLNKGFYFPVLGSFGGNDTHIPVSHVDEVKAVLKSREIYYDIKVYEGAPHSFFDRKYTEFAEACNDAWKRVAAFVEKFDHEFL